MLLMMFLLMHFAHWTMASEFRIVCYFSHLARFRSGTGKFVPENVDPNLCTHINYLIATPKVVNNYSLDKSHEELFQQIAKLKEKNEKVKVLLSLRDHILASTTQEPKPDYRKTFADTVVALLRKINFDGLDLRFYKPVDKLYFGLLLQDIRAAFEKDSQLSQKPRLLFTAAISANKTIIDSSYDVSGLIKYTDFINVMSFSYHGPWEKTIGFHAPLYASQEKKNEDMFLNVNWTMRYYMSLGIPKLHLNLGIPSYGYSYVRKNSTENGSKPRSVDAGPPANFTQLRGVKAYYEVCEFIKSGARVEYEKSQVSPFALKGTTWVSYDNVESVKEKTCYAVNFQYGGISFWTLDYDDFSGISCGQSRYPLLYSIYAAGYERIGCRKIGRIEPSLFRCKCRWCRGQLIEGKNIHQRSSECMIWWLFTALIIVPCSVLEA